MGKRVSERGRRNVDRKENYEMKRKERWKRNDINGEVVREKEE
jgi:hypothetical protein